MYTAGQYNLSYDNKGAFRRSSGQLKDVYHLGTLEDALKAYDKAIQLNPNKASYYNAKAKVLCHYGRVEAAIPLFDKAINLDPTNAEYYCNKGDALSELKQHRAAVMAGNQAIKLNPKNGYFYLRKGQNLAAANLYRDAVIAFDQVIKLDPKNADVYNSKGDCLMNMGNFGEAIKAYDEAIEVDHSNPYAFSNKGFALYQLGYINEAIKWYDKQAEITPNDWACYAKKGKALLDLKRIPEGMEYLHKAIDIINQGKLQGRIFIPLNGSPEVLNTLEMKLIATIKNLLSIPTLNPNEVQPEKLKGEIVDLNKQKDDLMLKSIIVPTNNQRDHLQEDVDKIKEEIKSMQDRQSEIIAIITKSGVSERAQVTGDIAALEKESPELLVYFKTFYWTITNFINACRFEHKIPAKGTADKEGIHQVVHLASEFAFDLVDVPLLGPGLRALHSTIDALSGGSNQAKLNRKVDAFNKIIEAKLGFNNDLDLILAKVALVFTHERKKVILNNEISPPKCGKIKAAWKWLTSEIESAKEKILPSGRVHDKKSDSVTLALKDTTLCVAYLFKYQELVIINKDTLDKQFEAIVGSDKLDLLLEGVKI